MNLYNGHLADRRNRSLLRVLNKSQCIDFPTTTKNGRCEGVSVSGGLTVVILKASKFFHDHGTTTVP